MKTKILFVCSGGLDRSPTAEELINKEFSDKFEARSCGLYPLTNSNEITKEVLSWADLIIVMETRHKTEILKKFKSSVQDKPEIIILDVSNRYLRNDPELKRVIKEKLFKLFRL